MNKLTKEKQHDDDNDRQENADEAVNSVLNSG